MSENLLLSNDYIQVYTDKKNVFLIVNKVGYSLVDFQEEIARLPRVKITKFIVLKEAVARGNHQPVVIGEYKPMVEIEVSKDRLKAHAKINLSQKDFDAYEPDCMIDEIMEAARNEGIIFGYVWVDIMERIVLGMPILIASGKLPVNGQDAKIRIYEFKEKKPELIDAGNVNYYDMNLINNVALGEWVGERMEPTDGIPGKTVYGEVIPAQKGQQLPLNYDAESVSTFFDAKAGLTILRAKFPGAVEIEKGRICVRKYLTIPDCVSFETGNIDFDGCVEIHNTINDNFSVVATKDIQVLGAVGIGGVDLVESRDGNIYIKGGIFGKDRAKIVCKGNLYTKFASNCVIECDGIVNIGYYAMNCEITAKEIIFESPNSKLIGGQTTAVYKISVGEIGSLTGHRTYVNIEGFKRSDIKKEYDLLESAADKLKDKIDLVKKRLSIYTGAKLNDTNKRIRDLLQSELVKLHDTLKIVLEERSKCIIYLKTKGEGEICINKRLHANVVIRMADETQIIRDPIKLPIRYYLTGGQINY